MSRTVHWLSFGLLLLIGAGLRLWRIDAIPPGFHFDEAFEGLEAWRILSEPGYRPIFLTGNFGVPPLNAYANAVTFWLAQQLGGQAGPTAMRVTAALFGLAGLAVLYALAGELRRHDRTARPLSAAFPLLALASLALLRWHIHFSRMGIEPILVPLVWSAATWLLFRGWRSGSWLSFAGCGAVLGIGMYTYQGAWVVPFLAVLMAGWLYLDGRQRPTVDGLERRRWQGLALAAVVAALLVAPLDWFFLQNPDLLTLRPAQLAVVGDTGSPADSSVGHTLWATAAMFGPWPGAGDWDPRRNLPGAPALNLWQAIPFYLGLAVALWRIRSPVYGALLLGLAGLLLPGMVSEYAPHFHRVLGAAAPAALLCGVGLDWIWQARPRGSTALRWAAIVLLALGGITAARDYFVRWAGLPDLYHAFDAGLWELGQALAATDGLAYISPRGEDHATLAFAWRLRPADARPVAFDGRHILPLQEGTTAAPERYAVIEHEDFRGAPLLAEVLPDVTVERELRDLAGQLYARIYARPAQSQPRPPPGRPVGARLGDGITLASYEVLPAALAPGGVLYLRLHWLVEEAPQAGWTVFTHLLDDAQARTVLAGQDSQPGAGSLTTDRWQAGWRVIDEYQIALPADLAPGDYWLEIGLYQADGQKLPADGAGLLLGEVTVE